MIEVIEEKSQWDNEISGFKTSNIYHTFDYHQVSKGNDKPILLKYTDGDVLILLPLLIRKIPNSTFKDATSVYGYPGPLCINAPSGYENSAFKEALKKHLEADNIISVFSRLNPFVSNQKVLLKDFGELQKKGPIVNIDLQECLEKQRQGYARRLKGQINKCRRLCFVKKANSEKDFQDFKQIYFENMDRLNAKKMYYFNDEYFDTIIKSKDFLTETLLAYDADTGEAIGGSMFIYRNSVVHYHLSGTKTDYLHLMPTKLLIDEMRIKATGMGYKSLNLGGGLSGSHDSLLKFKMSFSKNLLDFYVWKLIINQDAYNDLVSKKSLTPSTDFFPLYRHNE